MASTTTQPELPAMARKVKDFTTDEAAHSRELWRRWAAAHQVWCDVVNTAGPKTAMREVIETKAWKASEEAREAYEAYLPGQGVPADATNKTED